MLEDLIKEYNVKTEPIGLYPNLQKLPVHHIDMNVEGAEQFNRFYKAVNENNELHHIERTNSNGICTARHKLIYPAFDIDISHSLKGRFTGVEIVLLLDGGCRIQFTGKPKGVVSGTVAMREFKKIFKTYGLDLNDYAVTTEQGKLLKQEIESPIIKLERNCYADLTFENAHHLDFHSSYPTGLINTHPEMKDAITYMYDHRKVKVGKYEDYYKGVMNSTIGYMQSKWSGYRYTNLARDAINDNNKRIKELAQRLDSSGRLVIAYNTDGIWYYGDIYHDENEGKGLGTWQNDHINCKIRFKSAGSYEYMENGNYHPVVRGTTKYDRIKAREQWQWGDIYREDADAIGFYWDDMEGIIYE